MSMSGAGAKSARESLVVYAFAEKGDFDTLKPERAMVQM